MFRVYSCLAHQHNLLLVFMAAVICLLASFISFFAFQRALNDTNRRRRFIGLAALVAGLGTWATHFVAMLAFEPGFPINYDVPRTLLSAIIAVAVAGLGWTVALRRSRVMALLGGGIIGAGVAAMHYIGMSAVELPGEIVWDHTLVGVSLALGVSLSASAVWVFRSKSRGPDKPSIAAGLLLTLAICGLHFTAMAAAVIHPHSGEQITPLSVDNQTLAIIVTAAALTIMGVGSALVMLEQRLRLQQLAHAQQRAALADELQQQLKISSAALDNMAQGLSMYDAEDRLVIYNRRYVEFYGVPEALLTPGTRYDEIAKRMIDYLGVPLESPAANVPAVGTEGWDGEHQLALPNGRIIKYDRRPLPDGGWVATHEDVTQARRATQQIAYLAAHDTLTGLPNRKTFTAHLDACARAGEPFAVLSIDLDRFKEVNDTLGHPVGDQILKGAADRLREITGPRDVITRLGGDEFVIIQREPNGSVRPSALAARIVERLSEPFEFEGHTVVIGASVGVSQAPQDGVDGDQLFKMSDLALYSAKEQSRGTYRFFETGMDSRLCERRQLESDLRDAIRQGQFEVHYQPVLDMATGTIGCFEALVRWHHPTRGLVQPADFIATAEDTGLIIPIGEWVLRQACRDAVDWPNDVKVAVNLSPAQFKRGDLIAMVLSALAGAGLDPSRLELEITESVLLHDEAWVHQVLDRLAALGVSIAMDDFGTGYSSLSYLRSFPFTKIKIDRSFISDLLGTSDALSIVQATIQLSQKLGMTITAEGVETAEQLQLLAAEGCTHAQGFHVSRPVPATSVSELLQCYNSGLPQSASAVG